MTIPSEPELCYQIIVGLYGEAIKVEVLAEDPKLLDRMTPWQQLMHDLMAILQGCRQVAYWQEFCPGLGVSINALPWVFEIPGFAELVLDLIELSGLPARLVTLEIVESQPLRLRNPAVIESLSTLYQAEVKLALDDVGSNRHKAWSWVRRLLRRRASWRDHLGFRFSVVKIDRELISQIDLPIVEAVIRRFIELAIRYGCHEIVAEGVETRDQVLRSVRIGCVQFQGWRFCRKLTPAECEAELLEMLAHRRRPVIAPTDAELLEMVK